MGQPHRNQALDISSSLLSVQVLETKVSDPRVYGPEIRARLGTTAHSCKVVVLKLKTIPRRIQGYLAHKVDVLNLVLDSLAEHLLSTSELPPSCS